MAFHSTKHITRGGLDLDEILTKSVPFKREKALEEIKALMGAEFHGWFNDVHRLRSAGKQADAMRASGPVAQLVRAAAS